MTHERALAANLDHLEIGTLSFARCHQEMIISPKEWVRLIPAAAEEYQPDILVTAGHAMHTLKHLDLFAREHAELGLTSAIITEVAHDRPTPRRAETHAMYAITPEFGVHAFGRQVFAYSKDVRRADAPDIGKFKASLPQRTALGD